MEFFEKAHVVKSKESMKSKEKVKTQLKQMLYGYKYNDNELVSKSAEAPNNLDDSSSVSGFSDLNLTDYSSEEENSKEDMQIADHNLTDSVELSLNENIDNQPLVLSKIMEDSREFDEESFSNTSLSDLKDISLSDEVDSITSDTSNVSNIFSQSSYTISTDNEGLEFDADGVLASRNLANLKSKEKQNVPKKVKKRAFNEKEIEPNNVIVKNKKLAKRSHPVTNQNTNTIPHSDVNLVSIETDESSTHFESVIASEVPIQSLNDLVGDYVHPTIRSITIENNESLLSFIDNSIPTNSIVDEIVINDKNSSNDENPIDDLDMNSSLDVDNDVADIEEDLANVLDLNESSTQPIDDSINNDSSVLTETMPERESSTESTNTIFNSVQVFYGKKACILVMKHPAVVYLHGKVKIAALGGTVEILGHTLTNEPCEVFAPNYNIALSLKTVESQKDNYGLFGKLTASGLTVAETEDIVTTMGPNDGILGLEPIKTHKMEFVNNMFTVTDLFKVNANVDNCFKKASEILGCSLYLTRPWKCYEENINWRQAVRCGSVKSSRGIVCGAKNVGKSTFLRYYVNKMLENGPVLVVDLDPGQCEFTVAGNISATVVKKPLLGPSYTHLLTPERMLNIGMISPMDNTKRYMNAVESLITYCNNNAELREMPWIVNTMGMCNDIGLKFMIFTILHTKPTFLMQIDGQNAKKNFECHLGPDTVRKLYQQYSQKGHVFHSSITPPDDLEYPLIVVDHTESYKRGFALAARDERYLSFLAYFSNLLSQRDRGLLDIVPYEVNLRELNVAVNVNIDQYSISKVINGKLVALCQHYNGGDNRGIVVKMKDKAMHCYGHGLVRGIDRDKRLIYIITPVDIDSLGYVDTLVYADWVPELRGYEQHLEPDTPVPYRTASRYHQRQLMFPPRRRFNPLQLLKINRAS